MSDATSKKGGILYKLKKLRENPSIRSLFLVAVVVLGVFVFREVLIFGLKTEYPLQTPVTRSMEPTLKIGDLLVVQGGFKGIDIYAHQDDGDVIVFRDPRDPDNLIVHRAIDKINVGDTWYIITKGDNNLMRDRWFGFPGEGVPEGYLIGKVIGRIPLLGYVKIYLGTPVGMIISIVLLVVLLLLENLTSSTRTEKPQLNKETTKGN